MTATFTIYLALAGILGLLLVTRIAARRYLGGAPLEEPAIIEPSERIGPAQLVVTNQAAQAGSAEFDSTADSRTSASTPGDYPIATRKALSVPTTSGVRDNELRPAEIAYLVRGGDATHALIVLAADLMQRAVRPQQDVGFVDGLTEYERRMWAIVLDSVKTWSTRKAKEVVTGGSMNPIKIARRLSFIYNFVVNSLKGMIQNTISDPKRIKKYFSAHGLIRIITDFASSGYKQAFEHELRQSLLARGLLVPERLRHKVGKNLVIAAIVGLIACLAVALILCPNPGVAIFTFASGALAATVARSLLSLRQLIPFYEEAAVVAGQVERKSMRLKVLRILLRSITSIIWGLAIVAITIVSLLGLGLIKLAMPSMGMPEIYALIGFTVTCYSCADLGFEGLRMLFEEMPTAKAAKQLSNLKGELADISPLTAFRSFLESQEYNPRFSKILALYGIETLFLLV